MEKYILRLKFKRKLGYVFVDNYEEEDMDDSPKRIEGEPQPNDLKIRVSVQEGIIDGSAKFADFFPCLEYLDKESLPENISIVDLEIELDTPAFTANFKEHTFRLFKIALSNLINPNYKLIIQEERGGGEYFYFQLDKLQDPKEYDRFKIIVNGDFNIFDAPTSKIAEQNLIFAIMHPQAYVESISTSDESPIETIVFPLEPAIEPNYVIDILCWRNTIVGKELEVRYGGDYFGKVSTMPTTKKIAKTLIAGQDLHIIQMRSVQYSDIAYNYIEVMYLGESSALLGIHS